MFTDWQGNDSPSSRLHQGEVTILDGRLLAAQEAERRRIARELHDDVCQRLALLAIELDLIAATPPESPAETVECFGKLSAQVKELASSVHGLSHQLHPSKLEQLGLIAVAHGLCREFRRHGLDVAFTHSATMGAIPPDVSLCLYRVAQEALRNVARHSGSPRAAVELLRVADSIHLRIVDGGVGFDPGAVAGTDGLGLVGIRERILFVGGELFIDSRPGGGTRIEARVPLIGFLPADPNGPTAELLQEATP